MKTKKLLLIPTVAVISFCTLTSCQKEKDWETYSIDLSLKTGKEVQYLKKIDAHCPIWPIKGNMDYTLNPESLYSFNLLKGLNEESVRTDVMMGNYGAGAKIGCSKTNNGSNESDYAMMAELCRSFQENELEPYLVLNGIPEYAQTSDYLHLPDYDKYYEVMYNFAKYLGDNGLASNYETWNEPDLGNWNSDVSSLMKTSAVATKAIYDANPNATVSALGLAFAYNWLHKMDINLTRFERFVDECDKNNAFPDAFAWHYYGSEDGQVEGNSETKENFSYQVKYLQDLITSKENIYPQLKKMSQHLTEYHPMATSCSMEDTTRSVRAMFDCIEPLLNATDVTRAFWPMYLSGDFGVVDKGSHALNLTYNFLWVYGRMPVERVQNQELPEGISSLLSQDSKRGGVVVYNTTDSLKEFNLSIKGFNFNVNTTDVYKLTTDHMNYNQSCVEPFHVSHKEGLKEVIKISLKENEAYYIEFNDADNMSELDIHPTSHKLLKKENYYEERGQKMPYADIHKQSLVAYASMADNEEGLATVSARFKTNSDTLKIKYDTWGSFEKQDTSALGIRVDYKTTSGSYKNSVYYTLKDMKKQVVLPFGTEEAADEIINIENKKSGNITLKLENKAPANWNGEISVTFIMQDAGCDATAKFTIL